MVHLRKNLRLQMVEKSGDALCESVGRRDQSEEVMLFSLKKLNWR